MTFKQRLALRVHSAVADNTNKVTFPYGFKAYAKVAAKCRNKRISYDWR